MKGLSRVEFDFYSSCGVNVTGIAYLSYRMIPTSQQEDVGRQTGAPRSYLQSHECIKTITNSMLARLYYKASAEYC